MTKINQSRTLTNPAKAFLLAINHLRLGEFDLGGVLYHSNYFHLYEMAREALLRAHSISYPELAANGRHLAIVESHQRFFAPILYGEALDIYLWTSNLSRSSVQIDYEIAVKSSNDTQSKNSSKNITLVHRAWTSLVFVEKQAGSYRPRSFIDALKNAFSQHFSPNTSE